MYDSDLILSELDNAGARLARLLTDLESSRVRWAEKLNKPQSIVDLHSYASNFASAFSHIEKARMHVRALGALCLNADAIEKQVKKKGRCR